MNYAFENAQPSERPAVGLSRQSTPPRIDIQTWPIRHIVRKKRNCGLFHVRKEKQQSTAAVCLLGRRLCFFYMHWVKFFAVNSTPLPSSPLPPLPTPSPNDSSFSLGSSLTCLSSRVSRRRGVTLCAYGHDGIERILVKVKFSPTLPKDY